MHLLPKSARICNFLLLFCRQEKPRQRVKRSSTLHTISGDIIKKVGASASASASASATATPPSPRLTRSPSLFLRPSASSGSLTAPIGARLQAKVIITIICVLKRKICANTFVFMGVYIDNLRNRFHFTK